MLTFLDGIAMKKQWTFFKPRVGEDELGKAFADLTGDLVKKAQPDLVEHLRSWLRSQSANQRWFAAEIVGYHKLTELHAAVRAECETAEPDETWEPWKLNCLWAASRLDDDPMYGRLSIFLYKTTSKKNQRWILNALDQMVHSDQAKAQDFEGAVRSFVKDLRDTGESEQSVNDLFAGLDHLRVLLTATPTPAVATLS
jgi:hypothetical protein